MPPRASLIGSFAVTDVNNEVICPLRNQDGSQCRKRCLGEKRYRSMQEHIRRAHPEYYLPKLPATKESFELMISTPPHEHPPPESNNHTSTPNNHVQHNQHQHGLSDPTGLSSAFNLEAGLNSSFEGYHTLGQHDGGYYTTGDAEAHAIYNSMQMQQRSSDEYRRGSLIPAASAAAALAQLHYHRPDPDWGGDGMDGQNYYADQSNDLKSSNFHVDPTLDDGPFLPDHTSFPMATSSQEQSGLLSNSLGRSPADRSVTLPPLHRSLSKTHGRPRKSSLTQQSRLGKHERKRSKELSKRNSGDRKAFSAEPGGVAMLGKRWEDLIDAAASATEEEGSRDLTPIPGSPYQSPQVPSRTSLPPFSLGAQFQSFQQSPLTRALTPPPADHSTLNGLPPFESVESSLSSTLSHAHHTHHNSTDSAASQFHSIMNPSSLDGGGSQSSPMFNAQQNTQQQQPTQIHCAGCRRLSILKDSYACTNCICGLCGNCVEAIISGQSRGRMSMCPRCNGMDSSFKPFQLDLR